MTELASIMQMICYHNIQVAVFVKDFLRAKPHQTSIQIMHVRYVAVASNTLLIPTNADPVLSYPLQLWLPILLHIDT